MENTSQESAISIINIDQNPVLQEIQKCPGFENLTEDEVDEIAASLKEFSILCYSAFERL